MRAYCWLVAILFQMLNVSDAFCLESGSYFLGAKCTPKDIPIWVLGVANNVVGKSGETSSLQEADKNAMLDAYVQLLKFAGLDEKYSVHLAPNDTSGTSDHSVILSEIIRIIKAFPPIKRFDQECSDKDERFFKSFVIMDYEEAPGRFRKSVVSKIVNMLEDKVLLSRRTLKNQDYTDYIQQLIELEQYSFAHN